MQHFFLSPYSAGRIPGPVISRLIKSWKAARNQDSEKVRKMNLGSMVSPGNRERGGGRIG